MPGLWLICVALAQKNPSNAAGYEDHDFPQFRHETTGVKKIFGLLLIFLRPKRRIYFLL